MLTLSMMLPFLLLLSLLSLFSIATPTTSDICSHSIDNPTDPLHGNVRAGDDLSCSPSSSLSDCISACCDDASCKAFTYNWPWSVGSYMDCVDGQPCCCLKSGVPGLEPNKWAMNITSGVITPPPFSCTSDTDCNLNGDCDTASGTCSCDPGWRDDDCGELALLPAPSLTGAYQHPVNLKDCSVSCGPSSWGGLPLKGPDGKYHLFASQFVQNCTLVGWNPGSTVIRAVSDTPQGPYTFAETVFGTFHHNPTVRRLSPSQSTTGKELFVMWMIGADVAPPTGSGAACKYDGSNDPHHLEGYITMAWSESLLGPWNKSMHTLVTPGEVGRWDAVVTNPAPLVLPNSTTTYLYYRGTEWPTNGLERIGVTKAASWRGPYGRVSDDPLWGPFNDQRKFVEDPFVWQDARGFKMLSHGHWDENGYFACAPHPEGPWTFRVKPTYTNVVAMADGSNETLVQRERPQLWFDEATGHPSLLFTGVAPPGASFYGYTYTFAQGVDSESSK